MIRAWMRPNTIVLFPLTQFGFNVWLIGFNLTFWCTKLLILTISEWKPSWQASSGRLRRRWCRQSCSKWVPCELQWAYLMICPVQMHTFLMFKVVFLEITMHRKSESITCFIICFWEYMQSIFHLTIKCVTSLLLVHYWHKTYFKCTCCQESLQQSNLSV